MTGLQIVLLLVGVVFMIGSFMMTERLSSSEINRISELSVDEIDKIVSRSLDKASGQIETTIDNQIEGSIDKVDRAIEKETNEKIMAISEYSDTVVESMNKTHNEIMFLYSMLNDKHTELTNFSAKLQEIVNEARKVENQVKETKDVIPVVAKEPEIIPDFNELKEPEKVEEDFSQPEVGDTGNHNMDVLNFHKMGYTDVQIAQELNIGLGEVRLIIGLFKGER